MKIVKRVAIVFVIAFAVFYVIAHPHDAANAVQVAASAVWGAGAAIVHFFSSLAGS
ncbi:MAG TPA: hypothetical protein VJR25_14260 [Microbacterium sp.]|uniref:hypothetical protein n=1 Tax=Microbacterium sp. TaxID=51671 RepID=UPI002B4A32A8|nr:hypothetical protein [Microbacterium sp.]HKT57924.1 hypothetical protein [Microbacterium sp.]